MATETARTTTMTMSMTETTTANGRVKWFNNKAGYGFITINDCNTNEERDIFVHHSEIRVEQSQYKYLVQGEYVEFDLDDFLRGDPLTRADVYSKLIPLGVLTVEEAREEEDLVR